MPNIYIIADPTDPADKLIVVAKNSGDATDLFKDLRDKAHAYILTNTLNNQRIIARLEKLGKEGIKQGYIEYTFTQAPAYEQYLAAAKAPFVPYNFRKEKLKRLFRSETT